MGNSPHTTSIHILDNDSLLHVFNLYRPFLLGEGQHDYARLMGGVDPWVGEHWWYKLAQVCQRWRKLILESSLSLGLSLVCTEGTPVADMLAHSPLLPLVIDYYDKHDEITAEDEEGTILALKQRDRVRRIRLWMPPMSVQKLIVTIDEEYPILEYLVIMPPSRTKDNSTIFKLPDTLQAPHLRCLSLSGFALPTGSRLLTTAVGLVMLELVMIHPSTYFHPNTLLRWLSSMPQLKALVIHFSSPVPNHTVERHRPHMPITAPVALPNLRYFWFRGIRAYLEAVVPRITAPRLTKLEITFFNQVTFSVPRLLQFMNTTENLRFKSANFEFSYNRVDVEVYPHEEAEMSALHIEVDCWHLDWQVSCMAQIFNSLSPTFSAVEHLALEHDTHFWSSKEHNEVDHMEFCKLLRPFSNVKTLIIDEGLVEEFCRCLRLDAPLELLSELQELIYRLTYKSDDDIADTFSPFIDARQNAGRPITLARYNL
jgi:hypothetical protein